MRILLTGGGGFIGSHLTEALLADGNEVVVIDNFCSSRRENIAPFEDAEGFTLIEEDVIDVSSVDQDVDYVMHFASRASPADYRNNPVHTLRTNGEGTLNMLEIARDNDAAFMFASTSEVYGDPKVHPQEESYWGNVNPVGPRACYDEGKRFGEAAVTSFARERPLDWRIVRIFNTYGPRMRPDDGRVVSNFVTQALSGEPLTVYGDGDQTRSFCYVSDMVGGILAAMDASTGEIYNLGNPEEREILALARLVKELADAESEIVHEELPEDDPQRRKPDISKAREELGWAPDTGLEAGLAETIAYFRDIL